MILYTGLHAVQFLHQDAVFRTDKVTLSLNTIYVVFIGKFVTRGKESIIDKDTDICMLEARS